IRRPEGIIPGAVTECRSFQAFQLFYCLDGFLFLTGGVPNNERACQHYKNMKFVHTKYGLYTIEDRHSNRKGWVKRRCYFLPMGIRIYSSSRLLSWIRCSGAWKPL